MIRCSNVEKVLLATFSLTGEVQIWWEAKERVYWNRRQHVTSESFKKEMKKQYIPHATRDKKVAEFHNLVQGEMTIVQYENKFLGLSKYASHMVADE